MLRFNKVWPFFPNSQLWVCLFLILIKRSQIKAILSLETVWFWFLVTECAIQKSHPWSALIVHIYMFTFKNSF